MPQNPENSHFSTKKWSKNGPEWPKLPFSSYGPMLPCLRSIQLIGMRLFFKIKEVRVNLLPQNPENGLFSTNKWPKNGLKWPKFPFFYVDPMLPCSTIIKLIGMRLFFKIKEVRVDLLPQNPENGHFSTKNGLKMALNGQNSHFFMLIICCHAQGVSS